MFLKEKYEDEIEKLAKVCEQNELEHSFKPYGYPIIMTISPSYIKSGQKSLFDDSNDKIDLAARVDFIFAEELIIKIIGDFTIDDEVMNKIKNHAKKLHYIYLQIWYKDKDDRFEKSFKVLSVDCNGWGVAYVRSGYRP